MKEIPVQQYEAIVKYFNETTIDVLKLIKKIGKKDYEHLWDFIKNNCE